MTAPTPGCAKFVLTGAPGAGKTTIVQELRRMGWLTVPESFTALMLRAGAEPDLAALLGDPPAFQRRLLAHQLEAEALLHGPGAFLDRGTLDITFYRARLGVDLPADFDQLGNGNAYDRVFLVDPLPEAQYVASPAARARFILDALQGR
jgi:predicted ATPase